ncbi:DUF45 domain-containing protein [Candidatus Dojkabacteria bacterium]|nr:DUF45 domain-containing protein [Candidatus Dojkabacteria bacterium]
MPKYNPNKIIRSDRKTIGIQITEKGEIIVRAPKIATKESIHTVLSASEKWIEKKLNKIAQQQARYKVKKFVPGEEFLYMGEKYKLVVAEKPINKVDLHDNLIISSKLAGNPKLARKALEDWYREELRSFVNDKARQYAQNLEVEYKKIRITGAKTRWGSCSGKKNLNFSWRLIMAPEEIIDYVVVHELCHLREMNHSKRFWELVSTIVPDWKDKRKWFKENGWLLRI